MPLPRTPGAAAIPAAGPQADPVARPRVAVPIAAPKTRVGSRWPRTPDPELTVTAHRLVIEIARSGASVTATARRYPHAMNAIAQAWGDPARTLQVIDELLVDRRGGRRGLPADVLAEVLSLSQVCEAQLGDGA